MTVNRLDNGRSRVLIIEDDTTIRLCLEAFLNATFHVESVSTWNEAVHRIGKEPWIHAVLLDLCLPNGRGITLVRSLTDLYPKIPIVVITGLDFNESQVIEMGAQELLVKPHIDARVVTEAVLRAMVRHRVRGVFSPVDDELQKMKDTLSKVRT